MGGGPGGGWLLGKKIKLRLWGKKINQTGKGQGLKVKNGVKANPLRRRESRKGLSGEQNYQNV